jgi:chemotaxis protein methyltransferase CheR
MPDRRPPNASGSNDKPRPVGPAELGRGDLLPRDAAELRTLKRMIQNHSGLCTDGYKERVLRRRIAVRMRARGVTSFGAYGALLQKDPAEYDKLIDTVTINVSKFFRNASTWMLLRDEVVPALFALDSGLINIWSAGSAAGEEAYSIAILMTQYANEHGEDLERVRILGTDIDDDVLRLARLAEYGEFAFTEMAAATRDRWFDGERREKLRPEIREMVHFEKLDLIQGDFPAGQHLLFCRNVLIYFERNIQHAMFERFHASIVPGGYLQLGKVETLFGAKQGMFETISARERLFRRP